MIFRALPPGLEYTVNYGIFTVFSKPLFWLLDKIHNFVGNWGWAIVILTILIKAAFFKLTEAQYRSMARMRKLQPRIDQLKERYGDDRQRMSQAMMEMYKKEKVNPLGGCLPILVQIPIFIALYWVLLESVELRQAPFILWIDNLSVRDPYFILPAVNAIFMFATQKLTPMVGMDPLQQKMMSMPCRLSSPSCLPFSRPAWCCIGRPMPVCRWHNSITSRGKSPPPIRLGRLADGDGRQRKLHERPIPSAPLQHRQAPAAWVSCGFQAPWYRPYANAPRVPAQATLRLAGRLQR